MRRVVENFNEKVVVIFNDFGDYVGFGSVILLFFFGVFVREYVSVIFFDWRKFDVVIKAIMWEEI